MSNPGVVTLASYSSSCPQPFNIRIEDNIGESIHIHINDLRISLSINEFLELTSPNQSSILPKHINELIREYGIDPTFLLELSPFLSQLINTSVTNVCLKDLRVLTRVSIFGKLFVLPRSIPNSQPYSALKSQDLSSYELYPQTNYPFQTNSYRLSSLYQSIKQTDPLNISPLITINGQTFIRDGQHRAAILAFIHGVSCSVPVLNLQFITAKPSYSILRDTLLPLTIYTLRTQKRKILLLPLMAIRKLYSSFLAS